MEVFTTTPFPSYAITNPYSLGCHDNGYVTTLRSHITAGLKSKLTLMRGYTDIAAGFSELELPSFSIPDLFIPNKLVNSPPSSRTNSPPMQPLVPLPTSPPPAAPQERKMVHRSSISTIQQGFDALPFASSGEGEETVRKQPLTPPSYSSAVQSSPPPKRVCTPELDSSASTSSSDESDDFSIVSHSRSLTNSRSRRVNPNIVSLRPQLPPSSHLIIPTTATLETCVTLFLSLFVIHRLTDYLILRY